jgi:hypothetical protein
MVDQTEVTGLDNRVDRNITTITEYKIGGELNWK